MAAWTSSMRTTRCWFPVSADVVTLSLPQNGCRRIPQASLCMSLRHEAENYWKTLGAWGRWYSWRPIQGRQGGMSLLSGVDVCHGMFFHGFSTNFFRAFRAHEMMISDEMDAQCTAPGGRLWPGCLVQEQEGHTATVDQNCWYSIRFVIWCNYIYIYNDTYIYIIIRFHHLSPLIVLISMLEFCTWGQLCDRFLWHDLSLKPSDAGEATFMSDGGY